MQLFYASSKDERFFYIRNDEYRHVVKVLRKRIGDTIMVIDGSGKYYSCIITQINRDELKASIEHITEAKPMPYFLRIAISPTKNLSRFEWFLEKSVEIGISEIIPLQTGRSEKLLMKRERWTHIIRSAMKQSGNVMEPKLCDIWHFEKIIHDCKKGLRIIAHETDTHLLLSKVRLAFEECTVLIGPEGGFSAEEVERAQNCGFEPRSLGEARLRTETAGVVSCQIIKTVWEIFS